MWTLGLFYLFGFCSKIGYSLDSKAAEMKIRIAALSECDLPEEAYDKKERLQFYMTAYKLDRATTRVRANFTVTHKFGPIMATIRNYEIVRNTIQNKVGDLNNLSCNELLVASIVKMFKVKYTEDCFLLPGLYSFDDFDVQKLGSFMFLVWRQGRYAHDIEFRTPQGVIACIHAVLDITQQRPATKSPKKGTAGKP